MFKTELTWYEVEKDGYPKKQGIYLVYADSLDKNIPFVYMSWFSKENKQWELIPKVWADNIKYYAKVDKIR